MKWPQRFFASFIRLLFVIWYKLARKCFADLPIALLLKAAQKPRGECFIRRLPQSLLCDIFKHLPLEDRLRASEVCVAWRDASRMKWTDVVNIDLTPIPSDCIAQIFKQCPNLKNVTARGKALQLSSLKSLTSLSLTSLKLYDCRSVGASLDEEAVRGLGQCFEVVVHDMNRYTTQPFLSRWRSYPRPVAVRSKTLKRLQVSGYSLNTDIFTQTSETDGNLHLTNLDGLECLIFNGVSAASFASKLLGYLHMNLYEFHAFVPQRLRELSLGSNYHGGMELFAAHLFEFANLPLEVLFLRDVTFTEAALRRLTLGHRTLRILAITGKCFVITDDSRYEVDVLIPARSLSSTNGTVRQRLNVFFGACACRTIRFTPSPAALAFHPIDEPMPQFLQRADIAPIFEGVWIAEKILESAQCGARLWDYEDLD